jgi:hypothetical protein
MPDLAHLVARIVLRMRGQIPSNHMAAILDSIPVDASGVLNVPWGSTRAEVLAIAPKPIVDSILAKPGKNPDILRGRASLGGYSAAYTFMLDSSGFYSLAVELLQPCPTMNQVVSAKYGSARLEWPMPGPEQHTLWVGDGFEVLTELTRYHTGSLVFQRPRRSVSLDAR